MKKIVLGLGIAAFMVLGGVGASYAVINSNDGISTVKVEKEKDKDKKGKKDKKGCCSGEEKAKCGEKPAGGGGCCAGKKGA